MATRSFEKRVTETLAAQDTALAELSTKLQAPILNGGFDKLLLQVDKIERIQEDHRKLQDETCTKVSEVHAAVFDHKDGLYIQVQAARKWIKTANVIIKSIGAALGVGLVSGLGTLLWQIFQGHIHYVP